MLQTLGYSWNTWQAIHIYSSIARLKYNSGFAICRNTFKGHTKSTQVYRTLCSCLKCPKAWASAAGIASHLYLVNSKSETPGQWVTRGDSAPLTTHSYIYLLIKKILVCRLFLDTWFIPRDICTCIINPSFIVLLYSSLYSFLFAIIFFHKLFFIKMRPTPINNGNWKSKREE